MDKKAKQAIMGSCAVLAVILVVVAVLLVKKFTPNKEVLPLTEYYDVKEGEVMVILQDQIYEKSGYMIDGAVYLDYNTVIEKFNSRFYWDNNENVLIYTTPTEVIKAEVGSKDYYKNKSKNTMQSPIVKTNGNEVYILIEYIQMFSDMRYEVYDSPKRVVIEYQWGEYLYSTVEKPGSIRSEASIKSPIVGEVPKGEVLLYVDTDEVVKGKFTKVMTKDGVIGYIQNKYISSSYYDHAVSTYQAPEYTHITKDYTINMAWHQVTNVDANKNLMAALDGTKGITTISPTWFSVDSNEGTIASLASEEYVEKAHNNGIEVWALVDDFTYDVNMYEVLSYTSRREKLTNELMAEAIKYNLDGINVDFEKIPKDAAVHYVQFLRELSVKCRNNGIVLSVDNYVPAPYNSYYNLTEQGEIVDYVVIMAYDEHYQGSEESGSVSSIGYVNKAIQDTLAMVPAKRTIIAIPFYTRIWKETTEGGTTKISSEAYSMEAAWNFMVDRGVEPVWDETTGQYYAEYQEDNVLYRCWLEEEESTEERMKLISEASVAGVSGWKLGLEKKSIWNVIIKYVN